VVGLNREETLVVCSNTVGELASNLCELLGVETDFLPSRVEKGGSEEKNFFRGVVFL